MSKKNLLTRRNALKAGLGVGAAGLIFGVAVGANELGEYIAVRGRRRAGAIRSEAELKET